jgi:hypothetical protein
MYMSQMCMLRCVICFMQTLCMRVNGVIATRDKDGNMMACTPNLLDGNKFRRVECPDCAG